MVKSLRLNSKRISNDQPLSPLLEKEISDSQPNDACIGSKTIHEEQVEVDTGEHILKKRRGHTINAKFQKKKEKRMEKGKSLDIQFPPPFYKLCGKHAKYFKSEATVCVRQKATLQVYRWKKISEGDVDIMWKHMKDKLNLPDEVKEYAMKQLQLQYKNRLYHLGRAYIEKKGRPEGVSPDDWNWLIKNKWCNSKFQERSLKNKVNRSKQGIRCITGTKSIVQKAFEMKEDSKVDEWPDAFHLWKATRMRANWTWCVSNGEEIMEQLQIIGEVYQEEISNAPIPLVEHFAMALGRKPNHSLGVGTSAVTKKFTHKQLIQIQVEAAEKRANDLELEVQKLTEITKKQEEANVQLQSDLQCQREMIDAQRAAMENQQEQIRQDIEKEMKRQMSALLGELSFNGLSSGLDVPNNKDQNS